MDWTEQRPWGRFKNLYESSSTKVKLIEVDSKARLSYQSHERRQETWTIISGKAKVTLDENDHELSQGDSICIPMRAKHRIENIGSETLSFIEVQTGSYFGEDDIQRYQDDYGRKSV